MKAVHNISDTIKTFYAILFTVFSSLVLVQAATLYPDMPVSGPTDQFPFAPFDVSGLVTSEAPKSGTPQIAEWTRQNDPGDTMALSGEGLDGDIAGFVFGDGSGTVSDGLIQRLDGRLAAVTLPDDLTDDDFYLMWPMNGNGFGEPVGINQTEVWWVGSDVVWGGQTFSVYGRNLDLGDGLCQAYIEGYGWLDNDSVNPYKADFTVPDSLTNGTYTVYVHNGHGGKYGWSDPLTFTVRDAIVWGENTNNWFDVTDYGATGDGVTDDYASVEAAIQASGGDYKTVYFPAGTYLLTKAVYARYGETRLKGAGMDQTVLLADASFLVQSSDSGAVVDLKSDTYVEDMEINSGDSGAPVLKVHGIGGPYDYQVFNRVKMSSYSKGPEGGYAGAWVTVINLASANYFFANDCIFELSAGNIGGGSGEHHHYRNCEFIGADDNNSLMSYSGEYASLVNCTARSLDAGSPNNDTWCKGRWISGGGQVGYFYLGDNTSSNMMPRMPTTEWWGNAIASSNGPSYTNPLGTFDSYYVQVDSDFDDVKISAWPNSTLIDIDGHGRWEAISADRDTRWIRVWKRGSSLDISSSATATMTESVDQNSGEQFMWESHAVYYRGYPSRVTDGSSFVLDGLEDDYSDYTFSIVDGRGAGQWAEIESINTETGAIVLETPLRVIPDETSQCKIGKYMRRMAFYGNNQNGHSSYENRYSATCAVSCYGNALDICYDNNTASEMESGFILFTFPEHITYHPISPALFTYVANNTIHSVDSGISLLATDFDSGSNSYDDQTLFGNVIRGNIISNTLTGISYNTANGAYHINLNILQDNTILDCSKALISTTENLYNQVWVGNTLIGDGSGIAIDFNGTGQTPALHRNTYSNFSADYDGDTPGAVLELPIRYARMSGSATEEIPVWNSGTAPLSWQASCQDEWLELIQPSGTVTNENDAGELVFTLASTPSVGSSALITVIDGDNNTKYIKVVYEEDGSISVEALIGPSFPVPAELVGKTVTVSVVETLLRDDEEVPLPGKIPQTVEGSRCLFEDNGELRLYISPTTFNLIPGRPYRWTILEQVGGDEVEVATKIFFWAE